jgi:hypothetical protein
MREQAVAIATGFRWFRSASPFRFGGSLGHDGTASLVLKIGRGRISPDRTHRALVRSGREVARLALFTTARSDGGASAASLWRLLESRGLSDVKVPLHVVGANAGDGPRTRRLFPIGRGHRPPPALRRGWTPPSSPLSGLSLSPGEWLEQKVPSPLDGPFALLGFATGRGWNAGSPALLTVNLSGTSRGSRNPRPLGPAGRQIGIERLVRPKSSPAGFSHLVDVGLAFENAF